MCVTMWYVFTTVCAGVAAHAKVTACINGSAMIERTVGNRHQLEYNVSAQVPVPYSVSLRHVSVFSLRVVGTVCDCCCFCFVIVVVIADVNCSYVNANVFSSNQHRQLRRCVQRSTN